MKDRSEEIEQMNKRGQATELKKKKYASKSKERTGTLLTFLKNRTEKWNKNILKYIRL